MILKRFVLVMILFSLLADTSAAFSLFNKKKDIIGKWKVARMGDTFEFKEDGVLEYRFTSTRDKKLVVNKERLEKSKASDPRKGVSIGTYKLIKKNRIRIELPITPVYSGWPLVYSTWKINEKGHSMGVKVYLVKESDKKQSMTITAGE